MRPKGVLIDCGGTLLEEPSFDHRRGNEWLLGTMKEVGRKFGRRLDVHIFQKILS